MAACNYGSFNLNDGINYFLLERQGMGMTTVQSSYAKMGRMEGMKKTGETTNERTFTLKVLVVGTSRADLENKFDTMLQALNTRQQNLQIHTNDTRYFIADCIDVQTPFSQLQKTDPNGVQYCTTYITFLALQPYAFAASASSQVITNGAATLLSGSQYYRASFVTGGGNVFSRPHVTITKGDATTWTALSIQQSTDNQTLVINTHLPSANGDFIDIYCDPLAANGYTVVLNGSTQCAFSGIFPVQEATQVSWFIYVTASAAPSFAYTFAWTPRWLS